MTNCATNSGEGYMEECTGKLHCGPRLIRRSASRGSTRGSREPFECAIRSTGPRAAGEALDLPESSPHWAANCRECSGLGFPHCQTRRKGHCAYGKETFSDLLSGPAGLLTSSVCVKSGWRSVEICFNTLGRIRTFQCHARRRRSQSRTGCWVVLQLFRQKVESWHDN